MRLRAGLPSLRCWKEYEVLLGAFRTGCERFGFRLVHYAVMGNHLHLLTEGDDRRGHWRGTQGLAIRIAKRLNKLWGRKGKVFHERFHGRDLKTPREVRGVLEYLMHNARRHGYRVAAVGPDPYSSGRWFDGWRGWRADTLWAAPLARARAWITTRGWRRCGLIEAVARGS
jgi:REP element-mobilizing transposase RayT